MLIVFWHKNILGMLNDISTNLDIYKKRFSCLQEEKIPLSILYTLAWQPSWRVQSSPTLKFCPYNIFMVHIFDPAKS